METKNNTRIKAIIFDWAGVFCSPGEPFSHLELQKTLGLSADEIGAKVLSIQDEYYRGKINTEEFWKKIINFYNLKNLGQEDLSLAYLSSYRIFPEMLELATQLKGKYKTLLLSNLTAEMMNDIIQKYSVKKYFHETLFSNEIGLMKPEPGIYKLAQEKLKTLPEETIFIDDGEKNVQMASKLGFNSILFTDYKKLLDNLRALGVE